MRFALVVVLLGSLLGCQAQDGKRSGSNTLATKKDSVSYGIGYNIGRNLVRDSVEVNPEALALGIREASLDSAKRTLSQQAVDSTMRTFQTEMMEKQMATAKAQGEKNKIEGEAFLAANKTKEGVVTLPDGLQYKVIKDGSGPSPKANQTVTVNYRGTLIDGKEFDSSYKHGEPATFPCSNVIRGWTEALLKMKVGSKWMLWIPPDLAYGERGAGGVIPPNATLAFEIELLAVK
ncbi:MAG TPA: FKBP-type peptidyl-prolyl cis-trans isomerase [Bacteroidota bacterium]